MPPARAGYTRRAMDAHEHEQDPEQDDDAVESEDAIDAWIRQALETCYHPVGTCKMGLASDPMAVVDGELRLQGLQGLRVVDASVMPAIVSGNTNAPTIAIAERASDMIRGRPPLTRLDAPVWIHPNWEKAQR